MSQIRIPSLASGLLLSLFVFALSGCGDKNSQADLNLISGKHPAAWVSADHAVAAKDHTEACTECHGGDFMGGVSKIACKDCHLGNEEKIHPLQWGQFSYSGHGGYVKLNGTKGCANANCHGPNLTGANGPSCSSCHMGGPASVHPINWTSIKDHGVHVNTVETESCKNVVCHGPNGQGIPNVVPACLACHANISL